MSLTALACALVAGLALAYGVEEARRLRARRLMRYVGRKQAGRRVLGSLVVAGLMVLVYMGLEVIDPHAAPRRFVTVWGVAAMSTVLLFALAVLDLKELRANRELERAREALRLAAASPPGRLRQD